MQEVDGVEAPTRTGVELLSGSAAAAPADVLIVGVAQSPDGAVLAPKSEDVDKAFGGGLIELLRSCGSTGKADEVVRIPSSGVVQARVVLAVGLGTVEGDAPTAEQVRRASGAAARALSGVDHAVSTLSRLDLAATVEGSLLGAYRFADYKSSTPPLARLGLLTEGAGHTEVLRRAEEVAEAVTLARDLVNLPPNDLFPQSFADRTVALGKQYGLDVETLDHEDLAAQGFNGILAVGMGSTRRPWLVRLRYRADRPKARIALVGKGVTFDTGGISLKPAQNMDEMSADMAGAAAIVATVVLAAKLQLPLDVVATVPMAENMPSGSAYRPGDVIRMYGGKTVEVINTDAEGRLILGEAIVRAAEDEPDHLIEVSTLTGAQQVALGNRTYAVLGTPELRDRVVGHAQATGEGAWPMPLAEDVRAGIDSQIADLKNSPGHKIGGMLAAAHFLAAFVPDGLPWAHLDMAGPGQNTGSAWGYTGPGATGVPVRTLAALLLEVAGRG
ncbi:leucyl aminopeptidase [Kribbella sp. NPDC048915]|uniref:leucyl aminopeptidase n=1 Tax=Kribbella sp. NPDC048915 TaxID=3155148 RepID=UPI0033DE55B5